MLSKYGRDSMSPTVPRFGNYEIEFIFVAQQLYITLDFIRNVRDYLNGLSQIIAAALFVDNAFVDTSGCNIVGLCGLDTRKRS